MTSKTPSLTWMPKSINYAKVFQSTLTFSEVAHPDVNLSPLNILLHLKKITRIDFFHRT